MQRAAWLPISSATASTSLGHDHCTPRQPRRGDHGDHATAPSCLGVGPKMYEADNSDWVANGAVATHILTNTQLSGGQRAGTGEVGEDGRLRKHLVSCSPSVRTPTGRGAGTRRDRDGEGRTNRAPGRSLASRLLRCAGGEPGDHQKTGISAIRGPGSPARSGRPTARCRVRPDHGGSRRTTRAIPAGRSTAAGRWPSRHEPPPSIALTAALILWPGRRRARPTSRAPAPPSCARTARPSATGVGLELDPLAEAAGSAPRP